MHFLTKLHSNSILTGSLDSYCLVCDNYLRSEDEAFTHTEKPIHKKNIGMAVRVEKFLDDRIVKVKKGYYCPFCNILLSTTTKVSIHIADPNHIENKRSQMLTRIDNTIIAFDEVAITLESWHGITENTCIICNIEFDDIEHSKDQAHMLKLIQNKCEIGDGYIYRKVDEDSFFCLICGSVFAINEKPNHHESSGHRHLYSTGRELKKKIPSVTQVETKPIIPNVKEQIFQKTELNIETAKKFDVNKVQTEIKRTDTYESKKTEIANAKQCIDAKKAKPEVKTDQVSDKEYLTIAKNVDKTAKIQEEKDTIAHFNKVLDGTKVIAKNIHNNTEVTTDINLTNEKSGNNAASQANEEKQKYNILDKVEEFQKKGINIDFTWEKARCKKCYENVPFNTVAIEKHIEQHFIKIDTGNVPNTDMTKKSDNANEKQTKTVENSHANEKQAKKVGISKDNEKQTKKADITNDNEAQPKKFDKSNDKQSKQDKENNKLKKSNKQSKKGNKTNDKQSKKLENSNCNHTNNIDNTNGKQPQQENKSIEKQQQNSIEKKSNQIADINEKSNSKEIKSDAMDLATFAHENQMVILPNEAFCPCCKVGTSLNIQAITTHVNLKTHEENIKHEASPLGKKVNSLEYMETVINVESGMGSDLILNKKHLLRQNSFHCIIMEDEKYNCALCGMDFSSAGEDLMQHINKTSHKKKLGYSKVVTSMPEEFVREISPNVYHCGYAMRSSVAGQLWKNTSPVPCICMQTDMLNGLLSDVSRS